MNKSKNGISRLHLTFIFASVVFAIMLLTMIIVFVVMMFMYHFGLAIHNESKLIPIVVFATASLLVGILISVFLSHRPLAPFRKIMSAADRIAAGDYSTRLSIGGLSEFRQLNESFNHMARELQSVEMLRTDFVNNFSHEFKTPIVSIRGFARMLRREDLSEEERNEYLDIIINESERLTELAANVLCLSRIEQQEILTDITSFNLSEQLRLVIALLEKKWLKKTLEINFECDEISCNGSSELLKQVWINLLDNAIKFAPPETEISIQLTKVESQIQFCIANQGAAMTEDTRLHLFDKFYQGDTSHTVQGNGLGLSIAKRILELHQGSIQADCTQDGKVVFTVLLPMDSMDY